MTSYASPYLTRRLPWPCRGVLLALGALLTASPLSAQTEPGSTGGDIVTLRDADVAPLVRVLRADLARSQTTEQSAGAIGAALKRDIVAIERAGDVPDPLGAVRARTAHFVVPADARYDAECSRQVSRIMLAPRAVFAIGRPATDVEAQLRRRGSEPMTQQEMMGLLMAQSSGPAGKAFEEGMRFYRGRGFVLEGTVTASAVFTRGPRTRDPLVVELHQVNAAAATGAPACARLGNTALAILQLRDSVAAVGSDIPRSAEGRALRDAEARFTAALASAGFDESRYADLVTTALTAAMDAEQPAVLDALDGAMATEQSSDAARERRQIAVRRRNIEWFQRHRSVVGPLLERWRQ